MPTADSIAIEDLAAHVQELARTLAESPVQNALTECRGRVLRSIALNYSGAETPQGSAWPPRKQAYPWPPLVKSGLMRGASTGTGPGHITRLTQSSDERSLEVGVDLGVVPYARAQDQGYPPRNLPAREFLGADDKTLDECGEILATDLLKKI